jgi:SAM-dependent methyltransferase
VEYAKHYARCCVPDASFMERRFIDLLARKAGTDGQTSHKIWSLKYLIDTFFQDRSNLRVLDCGAWNGWFLSYRCPAIRQRVALDFDAHFAPEIRSSGIDFVLADLEKGGFPLGGDAFDLVAMTSTLEHLSCPETMASEIRRVLVPSGLVFITVPDIMKYKFRFWDDVTHKRPFNKTSLRFLFETHGFETVDLCSYNHNLFIAGNLFPRPIHQRLMRLGGDALLYIGRKPNEGQ